MSGDKQLEIEDYIAHARKDDPQTSHDAAASVKKIRESQQQILDILSAHGPMCDAALIGWLNVYKRRISESGARTRRSELVAMGKVKDSGQRVKLRSGRHAIVWMLV